MEHHRPSPKGTTFLRVRFILCDDDAICRLAKFHKKIYIWNVRYEARKRAHSIIMNMRVQEDEVLGHMGDNFSACNHYDFRTDDYTINNLAEFHAPLWSRSRDRDDD